MSKFSYLVRRPNTRKDERRIFMRERNHKMTLRLNDKEAELLNKKSQMVGVSKEQYLRMLLLGVAPHL